MRTLVFSLGNTSVFGGVFTDGKPGSEFRVPVLANRRSTLAQQALNQVRGQVDRAVLCSVVPTLTPRFTRSIATRFGVEPLLLTARSSHGLRIAYRDPGELGTDRIAAALGARAVFGGRNLIVVDCGTATTVTALAGDGTILGGAILPGVALWPAMLAARTAQLPEASWTKPRTALGRSPREGLQSGIFHGHVGAIREVVRRVKEEAFGRRAAIVVGTGGNGASFAHEGIFSCYVPDLVLIGLDRFTQDAF